LVHGRACFREQRADCTHLLKCYDYEDTYRFTACNNDNWRQRPDIENKLCLPAPAPMSVADPNKNSVSRLIQKPYTVCMCFRNDTRLMNCMGSLTKWLAIYTYITRLYWEISSTVAKTESSLPSL
jgi:hypothetical protein